MLSHILVSSSLVFLVISSALAHPLRVRSRREFRIVGRTQSAMHTSYAPEFQPLLEGNQRFRTGIEASDPGLMKKLTDYGQQPNFMLLSCSDSRVSEGTIFNAKPGVFFAERNIANQFHKNDTNVQSVLAYAVTELHVKHVIVMGHYGCGGIAAAIMSTPERPLTAGQTAINHWIHPIRTLYEESTRQEIVELRGKNKQLSEVKAPEIHDPGFRALVEENVKVNVQRVATGLILSHHYALLAFEANSTAEGSPPEKPLTDVFVHGWVYDIENGEVRDLGVSVGPPGKQIPSAPFAVVASAVQGSTT